MSEDECQPTASHFSFFVAAFLSASACSAANGCIIRSISAAFNFLADMLELRDNLDDAMDEERANSTWRFGLSKGTLTSGSSSLASPMPEESGTQMVKL